MARKKERKQSCNRKFVMYVKVYDEFGFLIEDQCGWIGFNKDSNKPVLKFGYKGAKVFEEKEHGHGTYEDWKVFFEEEYPNWKVTNRLYVD